MTTTTIPTPQTLKAASEQQIAEWLSLFIAPDQITELRCLPREHREGLRTAAGFFDGRNLDRMAHEAAYHSNTGDYAVYFTPNPLKPETLERRKNRVAVGKPTKGLAHDGDVLCRRWLMVDVDPKRAVGNDKESSTDAEKREAWKVASDVRLELITPWSGVPEHAIGPSVWPEPIIVDSGNGYHLYFSIPQDGSEFTQSRVNDLLQALEFLYDTAGAGIDTTVSNPARIMKVPGTVSNKGVNTVERPHRLCKVIA